MSSLTKLRVAGAQIPVTNDVSTNVNLITQAIDFSASNNADILLTPEGSLSGYRPDFDVPEVIAALKQVERCAANANVAIALGTCFTEPDDQRCYNQLRFISRDGRDLGAHTKILRCSTLDDEPQGEINHYAARPLRTFNLGGLKVGGLICNDLWANPSCTPMPDPHLSQQLANLGAKIVFHAVNGGRDRSNWARDVWWPLHETNLRVRARSGRLWIVTVDNCHPLDMPCSTPSGVVNPNGEWAIRTKCQGKQFFVHTIEVDK